MISNDCKIKYEMNYDRTVYIGVMNIHDYI